jgi:ATP-dependent protease HslVU (ClpYQ) ATPase subunit
VFVSCVQVSLMATEGVDLHFTEAAMREIAALAEQVSWNNV